MSLFAELGMRYPIIQAPMAGVQNTELAMAVTGAGSNVSWARTGLATRKRARGREVRMGCWFGVANQQRPALREQRTIHRRGTRTFHRYPPEGGGLFCGTNPQPP